MLRIRSNSMAFGGLCTHSCQQLSIWYAAEKLIGLSRLHWLKKLTAALVAIEDLGLHKEQEDWETNPGILTEDITVAAEENSASG